MLLPIRDSCPAGQCLDSGSPPCCTVVTPGKRSEQIAGGSRFTGDILDPVHAVRFLLSETGTYTHDNGTVMLDRVYDGNRRRKIEEHAKRGLLGRMAAQSLSAFVKAGRPSSSLCAGCFFRD